MNMRKAKVYVKNVFAGILTETDEGSFSFAYDQQYLSSIQPEAVSLMLPLSDEIYHAERLFSFFDGLIPEGWLLDITVKNWKLTENDRMGLLLTCCRDCIGDVHVMPYE